MPTVTLNKEVFERLVGKKLPLEELKDRISMLGTDLEGIEGNEITVEIFPNRPDLLSEQGLARALSSFIGVKTGLREYQIKKSGYQVIIDPSVTMRPYTACALVKNLNFTEERIREIVQIQEKLATTHGRNRKKSAYGIYPSKKINFPVKYIAKNPEEVTFQPLGFTEPIKASRIPEEHPKGKAFQHLTEGWKKYPFFIDSKDNVMCMLPFTNSEDTGKVDLDTKEVFVECTGVDLENVQIALNIFVTALADMGGEIYSIDIVYPDKTITTPNLKPEEMELDLPYINKRLGLNLKKEEAVDLLKKMGFGYQNDKVLITAYRADILHQVDLVEDIAIAYGYENFVEEIPNVATIGQEDLLEKFFSKLREILIGIQLLEVKNYHLIDEDNLNQKMNLTEGIVPLQNSLGDHNHLRNSLIPSLLKNLSENQHQEFPQNIFEIGRVFHFNSKKETGIEEEDRLAVLFCHEKADFTEAKQALEILFRSLGLEVQVKEAQHQSYIQGRFGKVFVNNQAVGTIGEISPQVLENWQLIMPTVGFEINLQKLFSSCKE